MHIRRSVGNQLCYALLLVPSEGSTAAAAVRLTHTRRDGEKYLLLSIKTRRSDAFRGGICVLMVGTSSINGLLQIFLSADPMMGQCHAGEVSRRWVWFRATPSPETRVTFFSVYPVTGCNHIRFDFIIPTWWNEDDPFLLEGEDTWQNSIKLFWNLVFSIKNRSL